MDGTLEDRLAALERAVTDGEYDCSALAEGAATADRVTDIEAELADLADRVAELEAATQALRGYVGNVRSVNSDVEERADLALSKAEAAHRAVDCGSSDTPTMTRGDRTDSLDARTDSPDARTDSLDTERSGIETTGPNAQPSGLDALREPTDTRPDEMGSVASTQTDGGRRELTTDGIGTARPENTDDVPESGVLSRIRSLL